MKTQILRSQMNHLNLFIWNIQRQGLKSISKIENLLLLKQNKNTKCKEQTRKKKNRKICQNNTCNSKFYLEDLTYNLKIPSTLFLSIFKKPLCNLLPSWKRAAEATLYGTRFLIWVQRERDEMEGWITELYYHQTFCKQKTIIHHENTHITEGI